MPTDPAGLVYISASHVSIFPAAATSVSHTSAEKNLSVIEQVTKEFDAVAGLER